MTQGSEILEKHKPFIRLILRSADVGDGWRNVSNVLRKTITEGIATAPELYETREMAGLQARVRPRESELKD
jgi:uncharacterized protein (DUF736 family)